MRIRLRWTVVAAVTLAVVGALDAHGAPVLPRAGVARTPSEILACRDFAVRSKARNPREAPPRPARAPEPVRLRSVPAALPENGCAATAERWNFYGAGNEATGCFVNDLVVRKDVVLDLATGLMWLRTAYRVGNIDEATEVVAEIVRRRIGGFADWRLPTVEEQLSLLQPATQVRVDDAFTEPWYTWSADRLASSGAHLAVDEIDGDCEVPVIAAAVRAVRTLTREEWTRAVAKR